MINIDCDKNLISRLRNVAEYLYLTVFAMLFYTSWFYGSVYFSEKINYIIFFLKNFIILFYILILILLIEWGKVKFDSLLIFTLVWSGLSLLVSLSHLQDINLYLKRVGQAAFVFLFITCIRQCPGRNPFLYQLIKKWFHPNLIFIFCLGLIVLTILGPLYQDLIAGFGNSRVNFSIWLTQLTVIYFLIFYFSNPENKKSILITLLFFVTPIFILQIMTGGRSGMLGSVLIVGYFSYKKSSLKGLVISLGWLLLLTLFVTVYSPIITPENNLNVLRNISSANSNSILTWLDKLSSYRISLILTAFGAMSFDDFLFGVGLGNFLGWAPNYPGLGKIEVHNVYLKAFGEYGVVGFVILVTWLIPPMFRNFYGSAKLFSNTRYIQFVYFLIAMVHPDLMVTAVNTSLVFFGFFALSYSPILLNKFDK